MVKANLNHLSRRERQIMDVVYQLGSASAAEILSKLPDPPSYSAIRALLKILEEKGQLKHKQDGPRYVYSPKISPDQAKRSAVRHLMQTFFDNSTESVVATLLDVSKSRLTQNELDRLSDLIDQVRKEGR